MSPKTERRRARGEARHARRIISRRSLLKGAGAAVAGLAASIFLPRSVHAILPRPLPHPTWDLLLEHVGAHPAYEKDGLNGLRDWVHGLVHHPTRPQRALLLTGSEAQGKTVFHDAMGLLLPDRGVLRFPEDFRCQNQYQGLAKQSEQSEQFDQTDQFDQAKWLERFRLHIEGQRDDNDRQLKAAWLVVVEGAMALHMLHLRAFEQPRYRDGRFLKWSLASDHHELRRPIANTIRFDVRPPALVIPKPDLIRRLEDEREAFQTALQRYAA